MGSAPVVPEEAVRMRLRKVLLLELEALRNVLLAIRVRSKSSTYRMFMPL
jgi:hypothetical protein